MANRVGLLLLHPVVAVEVSAYLLLDNGEPMYDNAPKATIDYETRSQTSLRTTGSWRYSLDPSTEVLCLAYRLPYWERGRTGLWHPAFPQAGLLESDNLDDLQELFEWIQAGELVEAHNAWFERGIWTNKMQDWPAMEHRQWRCSAAKAAAHALPRALEDAVEALALDVHKDLEGGKTMKRMMKPRKANKADWQAWSILHAVEGWEGGRYRK